MTRTLYDIFANAPRGMLPAVAALLCVDHATLTDAVATERSPAPAPNCHVEPRAFAAALFRELAVKFRVHGDWSPEGLEHAAKDIDVGPTMTGLAAEGVFDRALARVRGSAPIARESIEVDDGATTRTRLTKLLTMLSDETGMEPAFDGRVTSEAIDAAISCVGAWSMSDAIRRAKAEAHDKAVAMLHRAFHLDGDPAKCHAVDAVLVAGERYKHARAKSAQAEAELGEYEQAMHRLGIDVPDHVTADAVVTAVHKAIQRIERESGYREHSINLRIVDHILRRVGGRIPNEPWPSDVDPDVVLERAHAAADGMMAIENAIAKIGSTPAKRMIPGMVVVASAANSTADQWLLDRLEARGIQAHLFQLNQAEGEALRTANHYGAPLLIVHEFDTNCDRVIHVVENGQRFTVDDWLASVEVRS